MSTASTHYAQQLADLYSGTADEAQNLRALVTTQAAQVKALELQVEMLRDKLREQLVHAQDHIEVEV